MHCIPNGQHNTMVDSNYTSDFVACKYLTFHSSDNSLNLSLFHIPVCFVSMQSLALACGSVGASSKLFSALLDAILRAPVSFFDTTPIGRIVNRFAKDMDIVDSTLPSYISFFLLVLVPLMSTICIILYSLPVFAAVLIPFGVIFVLVKVRVVSCRVVSCRVVSCRVVSCRVVSCRVVSCVVSCRVVSCRVVSCRVVSCRAVPCRAVPCRAVPCRAVPCRAVPCRAVPCRAVPCRAVPCRAVPCRAVPCRAVPCRAVPCRAVPCRKKVI